jgi:hypothetical protein
LSEPAAARQIAVTGWKRGYWASGNPDPGAAPGLWLRVRAAFAISGA